MNKEVISMTSRIEVQGLNCDSGNRFLSIVPQHDAGADASNYEKILTCVILGKESFVSKISQI